MKNKKNQTRFPVARIKKIMQKDEEVGKVAQGTPIVISKALELFLAMIIDESSKVTLERGSKKVEAYHLKHAIETTEMLDFLKEIVQAVPDPSAGGTIDLESEKTEGTKKKRGKGKKTAATTGGEAVPRKKRKKKNDVAKGKDVDGKSEPEGGDVAMDDDDEEADRQPYAGGSSYIPDTEDSEEDTPFVPTR